MQTEYRLLIDLVRTGPDGAADLLESLDGGIDWPELLLAAEEQRVTPLLNRSLRGLGPDLVPAPVQDMLQNRSRLMLARNLIFVRELLRILDLLEAGGVATITFKGPTLAITAFGELGLRQFSDLDILVRDEDMARVVEQFAADGYSVIHHHGWEAHLLHTELKIGLDVHRGLSHRHVPFALGFDGLMESHERVELMGRAVPAPSREDLLLILCNHLVKDLWDVRAGISEAIRLLKLADVAELIDRSSLDWESVTRRARALDASRLLHFGLEFVDAFFPLTLPETVRAALHDNPLRSLFPGPFSRYIFGGAEAFSESDQIRFQLRVRERWQHRLLWALQPGPLDQEFLPLPKKLRFLHFFTRPLRLLLRHGLSLLRGSRSTSTSSR